MLVRARCQGKTKEGKSCRAPATAGGLCYFHANPDQARILGQRGGRKNRYTVTELVVPENVTAAALAEVVDQAMRELLAGRLEPRAASAFSQLANTRRRLTETADLEARIAELEQRLQEQVVAADDPDTLLPGKEPGSVNGGDTSPTSVEV
jgi:hypothetical protein